MSDPPGNAVKEAPAKKRTRYTAIACNECKRRKIKCNGEKPCERCGHQNLDCIYDSPLFQDSDEYKRMTTQIETLQNQVNELYSLVAQLRADRTSSAAQQLVNTSTDSQPQRPDRLFDSATVNNNVQAAGRHHVAADGSRADQMEVDMSQHDGRIDFVPPQEERSARLMEGVDPLLVIRVQDTVKLTAIYTHQIHPIYPFLDLDELLWRLNKITGLQERLMSGTQSDAAVESTADSNSVLSGLDTLTCKLMLAIAAHTQDPRSGLAGRLNDNVQDIYNNQTLPQEHLDRFSAAEADGNNWQWQSVFRGMRFQALNGLWLFQQGDDKKAINLLRKALEMHKAVSVKMLDSTAMPPEAAEASLKLAGALYSTYWRWTMLSGSVPRFDSSVERVPPRRFSDEDKYDREDTAVLRGPFFEYAKLCSMTAFAFERTDAELAALKMTQPPWDKEGAVHHVNRWQASFGTGLKSLASIRQGFLASKSLEERIITSIIYLHAHDLRISICQYKRAGSPDRYEGPISELYESAKFSHDSITVLWNVHETEATWSTHSFLYDNFLFNAGSWLHGLLQDGIIRPSEEVKISMQRILELLEAHGGWTNKVQPLLGKLRESRQSGILQ